MNLIRMGWWMLTMSVFLTACVTVNIYFPAAAAEKAADRIIEDVWGQGTVEEPPQTQQPSPPPQSHWEVSREMAFWESVINLLVEPAQAQGDINVNTPSIQRLKNAMAARHQQLRPFYDSGAIGLTRDGLITIRNLNAVPLPDRNRLQQLVSQENNDRNQLYREIAQANGHPEWEPKIRETFAGRWIANANSGWWYQTPSGAWRQK